MSLTFGNLFFVQKESFSIERRQSHEEHHKKTSWVYSATMILGFWLIAGPPTFQYHKPEMVWNDLLSGVAFIVLSFFALKPYNLWAQWGITFVGLWLFIAPMIFWVSDGAAFLADFLVGTLAIVFSIIIPNQPGIKLFEPPGPDIPEGWTYNPSAWTQRVPVIFLAWMGFFISRYMGAFQLEIIDQVWDPFFGDGTRRVLTSEVSKSFPVSDATLGAFSYILDVLFGYAGGINRWRTMPWVVIIFAILIIPLGVVSITLIVLQPLSVGAWCSLCLTSAMISVLMIPFTIDEALATIQLMIREKKRGNSLWTVLWFGGTMEGAPQKEREYPEFLLHETWRSVSDDLATRPVNLYLATAIGAWVMLAPAVLGYDGPLADNAHFTGALIITFAIISMSEVARSLRFINILFGVWLIASAWIIDSGIGAALWNNILCALALIALAFPKGKIPDKRGGFEKYIK